MRCAGRFSIAWIRTHSLWARNLVAPFVVLVAMLAMAGTALIDLSRQETDVSNLDKLAFGELLGALTADGTLTGFQTELYHLSSTAANEMDRSKVEAEAARLNKLLDAIVAQMRAFQDAADHARATAAAHVQDITDAIAGYDWAARQMIDFTRHDAAYGLMMMGYVEESFARLRMLLAEARVHAELHRVEVASDLYRGFAQMRFSFGLVVLLGSSLSIVIALLTTKAITRPLLRISQAMTRLAEGDLEAEVPDLHRCDEIGAMTGAVQVFKESMVKDRRHAAEIAHLAQYDALTDLPNRMLFREKLEQAFGFALRDRVFALHFLDLDHFKAVNDTLGHAIGDELLQAVADRLREGVRGTDTVARLGGDEFAILQVDIRSPQDATRCAERIIGLLKEPFEIAQHQIAIGASVGIAFAPQDGPDGNRLLKCADLALYRAKSDGRSTYRLFHAELDASMQARHVMELELRRALDAKQLELLYQPIIDARHKTVAGFEALLRWRHPAKGIISPDQFIPLAEETGIIVPIGEWVLQQACSAAAQWPQELKVAVNLSAVQFKHSGLVPMTISALHDSGLRPDRLDLEVTETVVLYDTEKTLETLHQIQELGIHISLDDFGTGYSSLNYLRRFPFDRMKIDQSFIRELDTRADCVAIVRAMITLGQTLGMTITAEGVETAQQLDTLECLGCTEAQGYLFSRPVAEGQVIEVLRTLSLAGYSLPLRDDD